MDVVEAADEAADAPEAPEVPVQDHAEVPVQDRAYFAARGPRCGITCTLRRPEEPVLPHARRLSAP